jgi:hypothetical protein
MKELRQAIAVPAPKTWEINTPVDFHNGILGLK